MRSPIANKDTELYFIFSLVPRTCCIYADGIVSSLERWVEIGSHLIMG